MGMTGNFVAVNETKLNELRKAPDSVADFLYAEPSEGGPTETLDIDKAWHGIHFLLSGLPYGGEGPLALAVLGGSEIGEDAGYGPARYLEAAQVKAVCNALLAVSVSELSDRYKPAAMEAMEIYPTGIWESEGQDAFDYLAHWYVKLVKFYADAAERGDAMLLYIA